MTSDRLRRLFLLVPLMLASVGCDQLTKVVAINRLKGEPAVEFLGGLIRFVYAENPGAFLGMFGGLSAGARTAILVVGVSIILAAATAMVLLSKKTSAFALVGAALLVGGGLSNLLDRLFREGVVVDYLRLGEPPLVTGIFNLADVLLIIGAIMLAVPAWRADTQAKQEEASDAAAAAG